MIKLKPLRSQSRKPCCHWIRNQHLKYNDNRTELVCNIRASDVTVWNYQVQEALKRSKRQRVTIRPAAKKVVTSDAPVVERESTKTDVTNKTKKIATGIEAADNTGRHRFTLNNLRYVFDFTMFDVVFVGDDIGLASLEQILREKALASMRRGSYSHLEHKLC